ncbi:MAG TPA: thioredoxin [Sphaerochaeta sp.]|jgi:thioredoxin 1|nr:thioredoxin [Sphaerochaeta sp.]
MSEITLNGSNFQQEVIESKIPVFVDFWAPWCGPCRMVGPIISQIATKYEGTVKVGKVDVDENPELAESFNVSSIPTMILFKDGKAVAQRVGGANMAILDAFIKDNI